MSAPPKSRGEPVTAKRQLVEYLEAGNKPKADWRIGTEHEKFVFDRETLRSVSYEAPNGIGALLRGLTRFGWEAIEEDGNVIALTMNGENITLEPGDVIFTGTPGTTRAMKPGDTFEVEIEGIGTLRNKVVAAKAATSSRP